MYTKRPYVEINSKYEMKMKYLVWIFSKVLNIS